jgi:glyoxylate/hydroxypyruvate reductase A
MSAILLVMPEWDPAEWHARFSALAPRRDIRIWPEGIGDPAEVAYACAWKPPPGLLARFPNLKAVFSLGAGVDHLIGDPRLPFVPVVRVVDRDLTARMAEYVVLHVLLHHRRFRPTRRSSASMCGTSMRSPPRAKLL